MFAKSKSPKQGEILLLRLDPTLGSEIRGLRPVLVLSNQELNRCGRALVAPITQDNFDREAGWSTTLMGTGALTQGAAVISQCRVLDWSARNVKKVEAVPSEVIDDALARLAAMIES